MTINLQTILPNTMHGLDGTGFLFGAGTSLEAGYPMMAGLTRQVISGLTSGERAVMDSILNKLGVVYDAATATPNIEELSDIVIGHAINSGSVVSSELESRFRELIVDSILSVNNPIVDNHRRFFKALQTLTFGRACTVWIVTTNYDLLFEAGAALAGVVLENGFSGTTERFYSPSLFGCVTGEVSDGRFAPNTTLTVKLVKLHGSISWLKDDNRLCERHPKAIDGASQRVMVLPRRKKVMDTLDEPFNMLFSQVRRILGVECKYLVSCGFSYGDDHINQQLLLPVVQSNRCRLFALCESETPGMAAFKRFPSFSAAYATHSWSNGAHCTDGTDLWQFGRFVTLFE